MCIELWDLGIMESLNLKDRPWMKTQRIMNLKMTKEPIQDCLRNKLPWIAQPRCHHVLSPKLVVPKTLMTVSQKALNWALQKLKTWGLHNFHQLLSQPINMLRRTRKVLQCSLLAKDLLMPLQTTVWNEKGQKRRERRNVINLGMRQCTNRSGTTSSKDVKAWTKQTTVSNSTAETAVNSLASKVLTKHLL